MLDTTAATFRVMLRSGLTLVALGTAGLSLKAWIDAPHAWEPAGLAAAHVIAPLSVVLVIVVTPAVVRLIASPKRALGDALLVISATGVVLALAAGSSQLLLISACSVIALILARGLWSQLSDRRASKSGWTLLGAAALASLALLLFDHPTGALELFFAGLLTGCVAAAGWGLTLIVRNAPLPPMAGDASVREVYAAYAAAGVSPFALMKDKRWFWSRDRQAYLAYGLSSGVAVVLGPGVGPARSVDALYREFPAACHSRGWRIGIYQVSSAVADSLGWGVRREIGSEAVVDLGKLTLEGSTMAKLRHEVSRGQRNGITVQVLAKSAVNTEARQAMRALADSWLQRRLVGEMTFSVGCRADQPDAPTTVGLAYDRDGTLVAYCTWLALPGSRGIVLDEIRRTSKTPAGAMDLLLYTCMKQLSAHASWASLGIAPTPATRNHPLQPVAEQVLQWLGIASASASLLSFKNKFQPRWEPRYIVAERTAAWLQLGLATLVLHYPGLEQHAHRLLPRVSWRRQARIATGLAGVLVATAASTIIVAAAQSREGHPFYPAHIAAAQVVSTLPITGLQPAARPATAAEVRPATHRARPSKHHKAGLPVRPHGAR